MSRGLVEWELSLAKQTNFSKCDELRFKLLLKKLSTFNILPWLNQILDEREIAVGKKKSLVGQLIFRQNTLKGNRHVICYISCDGNATYTAWHGPIKY